MTHSLASILDGVRTPAARLARELAAIDVQAASATDPDALYPALAAAIDDCLEPLREFNLWGPENRLPSSEIWNRAGQWLSRGWLQNRARDKPRGYAGDYEMLSRIYEHTLCGDPLGRLFDRYFQVQAAPQAVRNRMQMMQQWTLARLTAESAGNDLPTKVAIVGSAFGLEVRDAVANADEKMRQKVQICLFDLDPAAIEFAREQLSPLLRPEQMVLNHANLFRLPDRPRTAAPLAGTHLLFCPGLFDYLDDEAAAKMLRCLAGQLAPGGRLIVFHFAPHSSTRAYMEWIANWYLTYRDLDALRQVTEAAGISGAEVEYGAEALGVDLYVQITLNS